jgi:hypothetical protein
MSNHSRLHNPNYSGPGIWYAIHSMAAWAKTKEQKTFAVEIIKHYQRNFPCGECKGHFGNYIETHPLEPVINDSNEESLFLWTFTFHNAVNHRLKKPQVSYEDAKNIFYSNSEFCMSDCSETKVKHPNIIPRDVPGTFF